MNSFCKKVIEYMYEDRLNQFISSFYELYRKYSHLDEEEFLREWFDRSIIKDLIAFFPPSAIISSFEELKISKRHLFKTYIKTYWDFCRNPKKYSIKIEEALQFFGLEEFSEEEIKTRYRIMVRNFHPDRIGKSKEAHMMMVKINYYYQILRRYMSDGFKSAVQVR